MDHTRPTDQTIPPPQYQAPARREVDKTKHPRVVFSSHRLIIGEVGNRSKPTPAKIENNTKPPTFSIATLDSRHLAKLLIFFLVDSHLGHLIRRLLGLNQRGQSRRQPIIESKNQSMCKSLGIYGDYGIPRCPNPRVDATEHKSTTQSMINAEMDNRIGESPNR